MPDIGSKAGLLSQLCWQIRNKWDRDRSLEAWHKYHADLSDDVFDGLYELAWKCHKFAQECNEPFCSGTLDEIWERANS
jgi:hypothetical protein